MRFTIRPFKFIDENGFSKVKLQAIDIDTNEVIGERTVRDSSFFILQGSNDLLDEFEGSHWDFIPHYEVK